MALYRQQRLKLVATFIIATHDTRSHHQTSLSVHLKLSVHTHCIYGTARVELSYIFVSVKTEPTEDVNIKFGPRAFKL